MGLATELSSAAALAAVTRLRRSGMLDAESSVVLILTSDGGRLSPAVPRDGVHAYS